MRSQNRNILHGLMLALALGGSSVIGLACDDDSDAENAAEELGDAAEDAADEVEDAVEDVTD
jgi:hypothetical protein